MFDPDWPASSQAVHYKLGVPPLHEKEAQMQIISLKDVNDPFPFTQGVKSKNTNISSHQGIVLRVALEEYLTCLR